MEEVFHTDYQVQQEVLLHLSDHEPIQGCSGYHMISYRLSAFIFILANLLMYDL